jgi:hypothetical protein
MVEHATAALTSYTSTTLTALTYVPSRIFGSPDIPHLQHPPRHRPSVAVFARSARPARPALSRKLARSARRRGADRELRIFERWRSTFSPARPCYARISGNAHQCSSVHATEGSGGSSVSTGAGAAAGPTRSAVSTTGLNTGGGIVEACRQASGPHSGSMPRDARNSDAVALDTTVSPRQRRQTVDASPIVPRPSQRGQGTSSIVSGS